MYMSTIDIYGNVEIMCSGSGLPGWFTDIVLVFLGKLIAEVESHWPTYGFVVISVSNVSQY